MSTVNIGQDIIYSVTITNSGNVSASNVIFTDLIPDGTSFEPNSFTLNGTSIPNADIVTGVPIGDIAPNQSVIVAFHINTNEIPPINQLRIKLALTSSISLTLLIHQFQKYCFYYYFNKIESAILNTIKIGDKALRRLVIRLRIQLRL